MPDSNAFDDVTKRLRVQKVRGGRLEIYLKLTTEQISLAKANGDLIDGGEVHILTVDPKSDRLIMHARMLISNSRHKLLSNRYSRIETITLEGFDATNIADAGDVLEVLEGLPSGFVKDPTVSLGLGYDYRYIVAAVEDLSMARDLVVTRHQNNSHDNGTGSFILAYRDFDRMRKIIGRIGDRAQSASSDVKEMTIHNELASLVGAGSKSLRKRRHPMVKQFQKKLSEGEFSEEDQSALVEIVSSAAETMARSQPAKIEALRSELQLVTLHELLDKFEWMLAARLPEAEWQGFFANNPFLLNFVFGYPIIKIEEQASIGGKKISGTGEKITDFLVSNCLTGNTAVFEIKTPQTPLLTTSPYRDGIHGPSKELAGACAQVLDQRHQFQMHFISKTHASRRFDIASYAVGCCVIVGRMPEEEDGKKSFELIRANSKDVQIVTFDELRMRLKQLLEFLSAPEAADQV